MSTVTEALRYALAWVRAIVRGFSSNAAGRFTNFAPLPTIVHFFLLVIAPERVWFELARSTSHPIMHATKTHALIVLLFIHDFILTVYRHGRPVPTFPCKRQALRTTIWARMNIYPVRGLLEGVENESV